jgi:hypothetical protein
MASNPDIEQDKPTPIGAEHQEPTGSNMDASTFPVRCAQDRFDLSDIHAILNPTTTPACSGRKPLFRR